MMFQLHRMATQQGEPPCHLQNDEIQIQTIRVLLFHHRHHVWQQWHPRCTMCKTAFIPLIVKAKLYVRDFKQAPARSLGATTHVQKTHLKAINARNASVWHMGQTPAQNPRWRRAKHGKMAKAKEKAKARKAKEKGNGGESHHLRPMMILCRRLSE